MLYLYFSFLFLSPHSVAVDSVLKNDLCRPSFQKYIAPLTPVNLDNVAVVRDRLKTRQGIGGSVTVNIEPPFSRKAAEKLHWFLLFVTQIYSHDQSSQPIDPWMPPPSPTAPYLPGIEPLPDHFKDRMIQSGYFSLDEIDEIEKGLKRYFEQIKQLVFRIDGKDVVLHEFIIKTEESDRDAPLDHDHPLAKLWVSTTHAVIGRGSWYETTHDQKIQITTVKTGEMLLLSEPYRSNLFFGVPKEVLDTYILKSSLLDKLSDTESPAPIKGASHGSSPGKRLVIVTLFELKI